MSFGSVICFVPERLSIAHYSTVKLVSVLDYETAIISQTGCAIRSCLTFEDLPEQHQL